MRRDLVAIVADIRAGSAATLQAIDAELNSRAMMTPRGARRYPSSVADLLRRIDAAA
jgi:hypothetical protein